MDRIIASPRKACRCMLCLFFGNAMSPVRVLIRSRDGQPSLQFLIFEFAFQLLCFRDFANSLVEIILIYGVPIILDGEKTTV